MKTRTPTLALLAAAVLVSSLQAPTVSAADESLRLDELLITGTHNSYHKRPLIAFHPRHRYEHDSLFVQLEHYGVRAMELDLHLDRKGRYEVYHIAVIDQRSHCKSFVACLQQIRGWSDLNRDHEPLMIWLELKDFAGGRKIESARPVDHVIRGVMGDRLITPDDVRGAHQSLRSALLKDGWPTLAESRGKILFMLTGSPEQRHEYTSGSRHLDDRVMFVEAKPAQYEMPWAAVAKLGFGRPDLIDRARASQMLLTTTVCVAEMKDAECFSDRDGALAAGFNVMLDDYVHPVPGRDYFLDVDFSRVARSEAEPTSAPPAPAPATLRDR